jgi:branched-chain amino acid transport system substrate-binding protein
MALVFLFVGCPLLIQPQDGLCADPIVIGVPTSLYTPFGSYGLKAVNLAVEEINAKGGVSVGNVKRPLKVVVADTRCGEPGTPVHDALMAYEKMITEQKPAAIVIGAFRSEVLIAAMDLVAKYKIPHLGTIAQTPGVQAQFKKDPAKYKYLFRVTTDALIDAGHIAHTLDLLKKDFALDKILHIYQDTLWAKGFAGMLQKHTKETGWTGDRRGARVQQRGKDDPDEHPIRPHRGHGEKRKTKRRSENNGDGRTSL